MVDGKSYLMTFEYKKGTLRGDIDNKATFNGAPEPLSINSAFADAGKDSFNKWNLTAPVGTMLDISKQYRGDRAYDVATGQLAKINSNSIVANNFATSEFEGSDSTVEFYFSEVLSREGVGSFSFKQDSAAYVDNDATNDEIIVEAAYAFIASEEGNDSIKVTGLNDIIYAGLGNDKIKATGDNSIWGEEGSDQLECGHEVKADLGSGQDDVLITGRRNTIYMKETDHSKDTVRLDKAARDNILVDFELTEDQITQSGKVKFSANLRSKTVDIIDNKTNKNVAKVYLGLESFGTPGMTNALETLVCINADKLAKKDVINYLKNPTSNTATDIIIGDLLTSENLTSTEEFAERALHESDPGKWAVNRIFKTLPKELGNLRSKGLAQVNATIIQTTTTYFTPEAFSGGDPGEFNTEDFNYALGQTVGLLIPGVLNGPGPW